MSASLDNASRTDVPIAQAKRISPSNEQLFGSAGVAARNAVKTQEQRVRDMVKEILEKAAKPATLFWEKLYGFPEMVDGKYIVLVSTAIDRLVLTQEGIQSFDGRRFGCTSLVKSAWYITTPARAMLQDVKTIQAKLEELERFAIAICDRQLDGLQKVEEELLEISTHIS